MQTPSKNNGPSENNDSGQESVKNGSEQEPTNPGRRKVLSHLVLGGVAAAAGAFVSREEKILAARLAEGETDTPKDVEVDGLSGASRKHTNWAKLADLKKPMATAKVKDVTLSKMFLGGNLVGGWAHARDLVYASDLVKAYHTRDKIFATFKMAEACGINAYLGHHSHIGIMMDYWDKGSGSLQFIADCSDLDGAIYCAENGAVGCYIQGQTNDVLVKEGRFDEIRTFLDRIREEGILAGLGGHYLSTIQGCVDHDMIPDFWMKTIHHGNYWSRKPEGPEHDNVFCREPEETKAYMQALEQPWFGFKILAAGAIHPSDGFRFALESGADFLCVGMYDFQIVDNVNTCMDILESGIQRERPWYYA